MGLKAFIKTIKVVEIDPTSNGSHRLVIGG
jgi:hypothetical protein